MVAVSKWGIICDSLEKAMSLLVNNKPEVKTRSAPIRSYGEIVGCVPEQYEELSQDAARHRVVAKRWLYANGHSELVNELKRGYTCTLFQ